MNDTQLHTVGQLLIGAYPGTDWEEEKLTAIKAYLGPIDWQPAWDRIRDGVLNKTFPPSLSEILDWIGLSPNARRALREAMDTGGRLVYEPRSSESWVYLPAGKTPADLTVGELGYWSPETPQPRPTPLGPGAGVRHGLRSGALQGTGRRLRDVLPPLPERPTEETA